MSTTTQLLKIIFNVVIWVFVPLIAIIIIYFTRNIISKTYNKEQKNSMRAGFWAGFILFIMYLIFRVGHFVTTNSFPDKPVYQGFNIWLAIGSGLVWFLIFASGKRLASPRMSGLAVLAVTFFSFFILLDYIFIHTFNDIVLSLALGLTFGFLIFFASSPGSVRRTLKTDEII
ncbi:MAG: hypothetical protein COU08_02790 [Candidatus Harrisonbacteria bacterium CG10_big_fil_rev_8_21_14_0_10_42_17]|uniref:Uncharacterized protein n=1 Tax=Candidatus Harrisonbacteria bacterium CG10_big_fil_rev_8_21_14_0_10_42_17 TaxID=1974584 RepID=A0A2M6WHY7_9BACT|nr:MAG: hypothetical protein COU08_02790 [Candidatus Harrisonbacteria bacterium CG10_big_fil_rev_8_21_14_0_10_42_17]